MQVRKATSSEPAREDTCRRRRDFVTMVLSDIGFAIGSEERCAAGYPRSRPRRRGLDRVEGDLDRSGHKVDLLSDSCLTAR